MAAAGGDGTVAEVLNGLIRNPARDALRLGLIPLGTANVLAHEIALLRRAAVIADTLLAGAPLAFHPGRIRRANGGERYFLMMAGAGFDAAVVAAVTPAAKRRLGKGACVVETLRQARRHDFPDLAVTIDGVPHAAKSVVICNGRHYGSPYLLAPAADIATPGFQVVLLADAGGGTTLSQGLRLMLGRLHRAPRVRVLAANRVGIDGGIDLPLQADGDNAGTLPVAIEATTIRLSLMTPTRPL